MQIHDSKHFARRKCTIPFMHNSDEIMFCKIKLLNAHYLDFAHIINNYNANCSYKSFLFA